MINKFDKTLVYKSGEEYVRNVKHEFDGYINVGKEKFIEEFINEYRRMSVIMLEELWGKTYYWEIKGQKRSFNLKHNKLSSGIPKYLQTGNFNCVKHYRGFLSGRVLSLIATQLISVIRGTVKSCKVNKIKLTKPDVTMLNPELSSKFFDIQYNELSESIFGCVISLKSLTKKRGFRLMIPLKLHRMDDLYGVELNGVLMPSIMLAKKSINLRYKITPDEKISNGLIFGADMGINKMLTLSDSQMTSNSNSQGKSFDSIVDEIKRCKHNSKRYKRKLRERDVFINEVVNKLDIVKADIIHLESNKGIKESTKNANKYWTTETITNKLLRKCQISQVDLYYVPSPYKSRRCFVCGYTHKKNRNKENFVCLNCSHTNDADINAAQNNSLNIPYNYLWTFKKHQRDSGFFWYVDGTVLIDSHTNAAFVSKKVKS